MPLLIGKTINQMDSKSNITCLVFEERGKLEYPEKNLSEQRTNKLSPVMTLSPGIEPRIHSRLEANDSQLATGKVKILFWLISFVLD